MNSHEKNLKHPSKNPASAQPQAKGMDKARPPSEGPEHRDAESHQPRHTGKDHR